MIKLRRAVVSVPGGRLVGTPKSTAGVRDVLVPSSLVADLRAHLDKHAPGKDESVVPE